MTQYEVNTGSVVPNRLNADEYDEVWEQGEDNYIDAWESSNFRQFMWNSTRITGITITGLLIFCIPAAYAFARMKFFGRNVVFTIMLTTLMIPDIVTLVPNFLTVIWLGRLSEAMCGASCAWYNNWPSQTITLLCPHPEPAVRVTLGWSTWQSA